ncbi:DNA-binding response regulator [Nocardioides mangrovicus]|uniref:DNA-binding response regulator n=1 Tax=Nocardioides mangrovicus TaxID=2478913 RepID=A0A3L8P6E8_9ACTN|nr:response regulator transcription factor [Nocardioides mangrovicus]RLV50980.1 DNA-binding response regulator [Nocardioides mangrovicus]
MGEDGTVRIALVNDYEVVVAGLAAMLEPYGERVTIVELDVNASVEADVDLALYDNFAQRSGSQIECDDICRDCSAKWLVVYSWNTSDQAVAEALDGGARGYLPKGLPAEELVAALEKINAGETVVMTQGEAVTEPEPGDWPGRREGLSEREAEVVALIAQGLSNEQVAARAFLSINTVKSYIRSGYRKMGVQSRSQAVLWALDHGFRPDRQRVRVDQDEM